MQGKMFGDNSYNNLTLTRELNSARELSRDVYKINPDLKAWVYSFVQREGNPLYIVSAGIRPENFNRAGCTMYAQAAFKDGVCVFSKTELQPVETGNGRSQESG